MIATVHYVVVVPKGKEYNQLVFHCITGVVARFGILPRNLPQNKLRDPEAETRELETITYAASSCQLETARTLGSSARVELRSE